MKLVLVANLIISLTVFVEKKENYQVWVDLIFRENKKVSFLKRRTISIKATLE